jgi:hypothetical protein
LNPDRNADENIMFLQSCGTRGTNPPPRGSLEVINPQGERRMNKISYVLAALATIAVAAPAVAEDKPMMKEGMDKPMMHHHHHHHHHMMKKPMMDKKM